MERVISFSLVCLVLLVAFAGCSSSNGSESKTFSPTVTKTATPIETELRAISTTIATITSTPTKTASPTVTMTATKTRTATPTKTATPTATKTATPSPTKTVASYTVCSCSGDVYNCADFDDWRSAQDCYDYCKSLGGEDVHKLDRNDDGCACESNSGCKC